MAKANETKVTPVTPKKQEEVIFFSVNENYRVGAEKLQPEERNSVTARVMIPSRVIEFYKNRISTLQGCPSMQFRGFA